MGRVRKKLINGQLECSTCHSLLDLNMFVKDKKQTFGIKGICKKCKYLRDKSYSSYNKQGVYIQKYNVFTQLANNSRQRAKRRGLIHSINKTDLLELFAKQNGKCVLTGIDLHTTIDPKYFGQRICPPNRVSIDRIDNTKGYTIENIQLVCDFVNRWRNYLPLNDFINFCILVANRQKELQRTSFSSRLLTTSVPGRNFLLD